MTFKDARTIYFLGAGGIGVSALVRLARSQGKTVLASDLVESAVTAGLREEGIDVRIGDSDSLEECDLLVHSAAVPNDHPQRVAARQRGITQLSYPEVLGELSRLYKTMAVAGSHGKSTTTAMLGLAAETAGVDPLVIVGTFVPQFKSQSNLRFGAGEWLIVEACEYRGHFNQLKTDYQIITTIDDDHLDYFKSQAHVDQAFREFANSCRGKIIANYDDTGVRRVLGSLDKVIWYSLDKPDINSLAWNIKRLKLKIPGQHNLSNALAVATLAQHLGWPGEKVVAVLNDFSGTWRRFEVVGEYQGSLVISDYAHHPAEVQATLTAARQYAPERELFVVFQPHQRNRTLTHLAQFVQALSLADKIIVVEIYDVAGREAGENISSQQIVDGLIKLRKPAIYTANLAEAEQKTRVLAREEDLILIMGAGDIDDVARRLVQIDGLAVGPSSQGDLETVW